MRAAMRVARAAFCILRRPAAVVCVHIPAVLLAVQFAAALDFARPAVEFARLVAAAPAWAQTNTCRIRETYDTVSRVCSCASGHRPYTPPEGGLTICQSSEVIARATECAAQGWRAGMDSNGRVLCYIPGITADDALFSACEWDTGLEADHLCRDIFGRLPSELTDEDRRLYPRLEEDRSWRFVDGRHILLPRNENLSAQRYRQSCSGVKIRDPNFRPPGVQQCVCNPDTHSTDENGECVLLPAVLADTDECVGRGWEAFRAGGSDHCRIASVKPPSRTVLTSCVLSGTATASAPACGAVFGNPPRLPEKTDNGPGAPGNPVEFCDSGEYIQETGSGLDCVSICGQDRGVAVSNGASPNPRCVAYQDLVSGAASIATECAAGPCHSQAICRDPIAETAGDVQCVCPPNYTGDGLPNGIGCVSAPEARECVKQGWEIFRQGDSRRCRIAAKRPSGMTVTSCVLSGAATVDAPACGDIFGSPPAIPEKTAGGEGTPERPLVYCGAGSRINRAGTLCVSSCGAGEVSDGTSRPQCVASTPPPTDECAANSGKGPCHDLASCRDPDTTVALNAQCVCPLGLQGDGRAGGSGCAEDCPAQLRVTNEDTGTCGGCLPGHAEERTRGICRPAPDCAAENREQGSDPFVCGACQAGYVYVNDVCRKPPDCALRNRVLDGAVCGACLAGHRPDSLFDLGFCRETLDCAAIHREQSGPFACGACMSGFTCEACEAGTYETPDGVCAPPLNFFSGPANGALVARIQEGGALFPGDAVTVGTPVEFIATPDAGFYVSLWTGACAGESHGSVDDAGAKTCRVSFAASVPGSVAAGVVFAEINECEASPLSPNADSCGVDSVCVNTVGSYECACGAGRAPVGLSTNPQCADINECELETHACGSKNNCVNTLGGHACACESAGWSMTIHANGDASCGVPVRNQASQETWPLCNLVGAARGAPDCAEVFGAYLDFPAAADHAENTFYAYSCPGGKTPDSSGLNCVCPPGQEDIGGVCDVDECAQTTSICGGNASCFNLESSYVCVCKPGSVPGPGATPQAPQCAPAAEETAANPAAPVITRPAAADFGNERFTVFWGPPADASGGDILQYRIVRSQTDRIDPSADPVDCDSDQRAYVRKPDLAVFTDANIFTRALNVGRAGVSGASHGICYRWHIAARTAAGWGPESVTDPILSRPLSTEFGNCPEGRFASLLGSCVRGVRLEGADACARLKKTVVPAVASGWFDRDQTYGGDEYDFSCLVGISNYDCGSLGSPARLDSSHTLCPLNRDKIHCGALSEYRSDHRECMCQGYATEISVTFSNIENIRGKTDCACDVSGADGNCECPAGMKYRPDLNACRNECATAGWAATVSAGGDSLCDIPVRDGREKVSYPACAMSGAGAGAPACDEVFGANSDFPLKADHTPGTFYAYNCPGGQAPNAAGTACACPALYEANAAGVCVNIDECAAGADDCPSNAACVNTDAGHTCTCPFGHTFSGGECLCDGGLLSGLCLTVFAEGSANCSDSGWNRTLGGNDSFCHIPIRDASATINADREKCRILNTPEGRAAGHVPCEDVFPDLMFPLSINHNAGERYVYNCPRSRERSADLKSCGACSDGHREKADGTCEDIDECATEATNTCGSAANNQCVNTAGSYECVCDAGYAGVQLDDRLQCADIDECELGAEVHGCGIDAACANTLGGHTCACQAAGWNLTVFANGDASCEVPVKNGGSDEIWPLCNLTGAAQGAPDCAEVFGESLDFPPEASHNAGVFYIYGCPDPQMTGFDRQSCVCPSGGELKDGQCADIDECQAGTAVCQENASCVNADPGYDCACDSGYAAESDPDGMARCAEVDECAMGTDACGADTVCVNTAGSYECVCSTLECAGLESVLIARPINGTIIGRHSVSLTLAGLDNYLPPGTTLTFSAIPAVDHTLSAWTDDCAGKSVAGACVLTVEDGGATVGALFARIDPCDAVAGLYAYVNGERQCVCPVRETILESGVCGACPPGEGILAGGGCGVCPDGRGIVSGGHCGACPDGYLSINNVCEPEASKHTLPGMALTLYNMLDAALESYQTPLFADGAPNVGLGALFTIAIREYQQGILDRHNGKADYLGNLEGFQYNMRGGEPNLNRRNSGGAYGRFFTSAERAGFDLTYVVDEFGNISDARNGGETERALSQIPIRVAGAQQCLNAGWGYSTSGESCGIPLTLSGGRAADECHLSGGAWPQCADAFGAGLEFPRPTLSATGATLRFIYNCDPTGKAGFVPAAANTIGGTECVCASPGGCECPDGEELVGGVCLPSAVADQCEAAGWTLLADEGACEIPLILWGGGGSDRCYFSGSARPQCEEVFGSPANYFPLPAVADNGATLRFVYNCDPTGRTGFIPATVNTFAATECVCPAGEGPLPDGVCGVCPDGGGILPDGLCGACPSGEIPVNNVCKPAATTHTLPGKALTLYNSLEAALESYQPPIFADGTPNFGPGALFTIAIREYQQGILDRHNGKRDYLGNLESFEAGSPNRRSAGGAYGRFFRLAEDAGFSPVDERKAELVLSQIPIRIAGAQECLNAGWHYSPAGESCGVPLTLSGGRAADECHLSGGARPQCADAFGAGLAFPPPTLSAAGATLRFVYNCDPDGSKRQVPATVNTFGATECGCAVVGQDLVGGVCACPAEQGLLADGVCGVCPVGQGVLAGGVCGFCPGGQVARDQMCACPFTGQSLVEGACACPAEQGVYAGACGACPDEWILENGTCVPGPAVIAAANATLLAEIRKSSPDLDAVLRALDGSANPNVTTSAGIPVLVVAATMLHAEAVSVLITAGADPLVKVDGVYDATYNRNTVSRFIPEALMERGLLALPSDGGRRLAETFIHFGDAAGDGFAWQARSPGGETTANAAFALTDSLRRLAGLGGGVSPLEAVLLYLLDRGAACRSVNFYDPAAAIPSSLCARPVCPATSDPIYSCSACAGFSLRGLGGGFCVAQCERGQFTDTTIWPDGRCVAIDPAIIVAANATLAAEIQKDSPSLAAVRTALDSGANANHIVGGSPALLAAASRLHAEVVSVLVTAGAKVNATESVGGAFGGWDVAHYAASRPGDALAADSRARRANLLRHFGDALDARNAMFADADFDWSRDSSAVGGGFPTSMLDRLAGAEEFARNRFSFGFPAGDDTGVINQMADYAFLRGARCVGTALTFLTHANTRRICESTAEVRRLAAQAALAAEVEKPAGAANVSAVRALLSGADSADPNSADSAGRPLLIAAARNGHAEIVSVLITAGAEARATDPTYSGYDAAQHAAAPLSDPAAGPRALRASVLYYFGGGLEVRNAAFGDADFDWNREDGGGRRLLDLLALAEDANPRPAGEDADMIHAMADYALVRGANCGGATAVRTRRVCAGAPRTADARASLVMEVNKAPGAANAAAVLALLDEEGAHPNVEDTSRRPLLILAARNGHAKVVSVLITAGADVNAVDPVFRNFGAVHHAASPLSGANSGGAAGPRGLRASVLYYFGGGLEVRNAASGDAAFEWNLEDVNGFRPLDFLAYSSDRVAEIADRPLLQEMADYLIAQGGACGVKTADHSRLVCHGTQEALLDEAKKSAGAADVAVFSALLENGGADPDYADSAGRPLLIVAARNGHAELVSMLAAAGADVNATDPTFADANVAHHLATPLTDPAAGPRGLRASVLHHFGGGLDVRKATSAGGKFDWNRENANGARPLDLLADAEDESPRPEGEDVSVIYQMADYMLTRGANCGGADKTRRVCAGAPGISDARMSLLVEVKKPFGAANVSVVLDLLDSGDVSPDIEDSEGTPVLIVAATLGHAEIVSVLVTAGADPDARLRASICGGGSIGRGAPHVTAQNNFGSSLYYTWGTALNVLRHFAGAVNQVGARYDWNARGADPDCAAESRALDYLRASYDDNAFLPEESVDAKRTAIGRMAGVLIANGASCENQANKDHVTCVGPPSAVTVEYGEKPRDQGGGTLTAPVVSGGTTLYGALLTFTATPANGWELSAWQGDAASCPSSERDCALTANDDLRVTALFSTAPSLRYAPEPSSGGRVTVTGTDGAANDVDFVYLGGTVTFTAIPVNGWELSVWAGDAASCPSSEWDCALTANDNLWVTAIFAPAASVRHASEPSGGGSVTVTGADGVAEGVDFVYTGGTVTFTAIPVNGWELSVWRGDAASCPSSDWTCALAANGDLWVTAIFAPAASVRHASEPSDGGSVTVTGADGVAEGVDFAYSGGTVTFTAIPVNGWELSVWRGDAASCPSSDWDCALAADGDLWVTAIFSPAPRARYSFDPADKSGGRVTVTGTDGVAEGVDFAYSGGTVTFTAIPAAGWERVVWTGDCAGEAENVCALAATMDVSVGATFEDINECAISEDNCAAEDDGGLCTNTAGDFICSCAAGYSGDGVTCYADKTVSFQPSVANGTLSAVGPGGAIQNGETTAHGTTITFTAAPAFGYRLSAWFGDCAGDVSCEVVATLNVSVGATFTDVDECDIGTDDCAADGGICLNARGIFDCICDDGYIGNGRTCYADKTVSFQPLVNGTLSAVGPGGAIQDGETVTHGTRLIFTAKPNAGWRIDAWLGACAATSATLTVCEVAATLDVSAGAAFADINECADNKDNNCAAEADGGLCVNTDGGFTCVCAAGYSGDGMICYADKTVSFQPLVNGTLFAASGRGAIQDGGTAAHGATVTFTVAPNRGWQVSVWLGVCAGVAATATFCEAAATTHVTAGAAFTDIDECETNTHTCAADGGLCANTEGDFICSCAAGYSGDGMICYADKTVSFQPPVNGVLFAASGDFSIRNGGATAHGTTITFTASPAAGYRIAAWLGACADTAATVIFCEAAVTAHVDAGVRFTDIDECETNTHTCAADGGLCANTEGDFICSCAAGYSGDGMACYPDKTVSFRQPANGTLSAESAGVLIPDGGTAAHGTTVTFTAAPDAGWQASMWTGACAGTSVDASAGSAFCEVEAVAAVSVGAIFTYIGRCAVSGHLIFGAPPNRRCAPPTICPANYAGDNDCLPAAPVETGSPAPDLPAAANEPNACEKVFGGVMRSAGDGRAVCSNVDRNDTFCIVGSRAAFPCRGLFRHVWKCNTYNRPALNPFFCGARCAGGANAARGRDCGVEILDASQ